MAERYVCSMAVTTSSPETLQQQAKRHLWMHFARLGAFEAGAPVPIIARGEGCYVWDADGNRYLDGLSALFCCNIGLGRTDVAQVGAETAAGLDFYHDMVLG